MKSSLFLISGPTLPYHVNITVNDDINQEDKLTNKSQQPKFGCKGLNAVDVKTKFLYN